MSPLPVNNTARYKIHYFCNLEPHTVTFRYDDGGTPAPPSVGFLLGLTTVLNAAALFLASDLAYLSAEYVPSGGTVSVPTGLPLLLTGGTGTPAQAKTPSFIGATGRSVGGRQAKFFMLGASYTPEGSGGVASDYRVTSGESATVTALIAALDLSGVVAIDNDLPLWKSYINLGYNAYWQKAVR
jgi:hypothetical protein